MTSRPGHTLPQVVTAFLDAINNRDLQELGRCFTSDVRYAFAMPHPAVEGQQAVLAVFDRVLCEATRIQWDVVSAAVSGDHVHLERIDRFWFDDHHAAIECCGVLRLAGDRIAEVRDYVDLQTWRDRKTAG